MNYKVAAFYRFLPLKDLQALKKKLLPEFKALELCGTLLLAPEGINGTLAGTDQGIGSLIKLLSREFGVSRDVIKFSEAPSSPFNRLKIRLKKEIITFRQPGADPSVNVGTYIEARNWNDLLEDPEVVLLDTRNKYETMIGSFEGARDPAIETFTEFADYVRSNLDPKQHKKIAMFCTGGIRCEKASAFMLSEGYEEVYHLKGGILKYLEEIPVAESKWNGECYVFDRRMAVGHGLSTGNYLMCFCCGNPLDKSDTEHPLYEDGVSCAHCHGNTSLHDKERYRTRHLQMTGN